MTKEIITDKLTINRLFEKWFRVPEYQRPYVWEKDHVIELLEDINEAQLEDNESEYFLGSFVFNIENNSKNNQTFTEYNLLDGQQRLTTLFLLIAVARDLTEDEQLKTRSKNYIFQERDEYGGIPERIRIVYDIRDEVKNFIDSFIRVEGGTLKEDDLNIIVSSNEKDKSVKNMANAILTIKEFFISYKVNLREFFRYLYNKVLIVYVASEKLDDSFKLFTVLNDRGVKLRSSDIIKANNLSYLDESDRRNYAKLWEELENQFGDYFDNFLSHLRTVLVRTKARKNLLDEYEDIYKNNILHRGKNTFDFVRKYKDIYNSVLEYSYFEQYYNYDIDNLLKILKVVFPSDVWIPPLLKYYNRFLYEKIDDFIKKLEKKASYEWIMQYTPTQRIENMNSIIKVIDNSNNPREVLNSDELNQYGAEKLKSVLNDDIYGKRFTKYILCKIEYLRSGVNVPLQIPKHISVEHVLPQNPKQNSQWIKDFSEEEREEWTNKLGNLVLISRVKNSSLSCLDFKDKKDNYFSRSTEVFPNIANVMRNEKWDLERLKKNHNEQLNLLIKDYKH